MPRILLPSLAFLALAALASPAGAEEIRTSFKAREVAIHDINAIIDIGLGQPGEVRLLLDGEVEDVKGVKTALDGGVLSIRGKGPDAGGGVYVSGDTVHSSVTTQSVTVIASGNGSVAQTVIGGVPQSGRAARRMMKLALMVPPTAPLGLDQVGGRIRIGDIGGPVKLVLSQGDAEIGLTDNAVLVIDGNGQIKAGRVTGPLTLEMPGTGRIEVRDADVSTLKVNLSGTGDVIVKGRAKDGSIHLTGVGNIHAGVIAERPEMLNSGVGTINVANW